MEATVSNAAPQPNAEVIGQGLASSNYLRERLQPRLRDVNYVYFTDLLQVTQEWAAQVKGAAFDYGCGGAPYRQFFNQCPTYVRADVTPGPQIDRLLTADGLTDEPASTYNVVLSSQVLEHVRQPAEYVRECHRILKAGGQLILTTHGMFEEHGCPYDFQRWTSRGLEELVANSGFAILESRKVTTEVRAAIQLSHQNMLHLRCPEKPWLHFPLAALRKLYGWMALPMLNRLGQALPGHGLAASTNFSSLYVGVAIHARKR